MSAARWSRARAVVGAAGILLLCAAEASAALGAQTTPTAATPVYREVVDEAGRTVRIPQSVQRIVSLAPSLTETLYALGLQDRLAGDTDYCDYPPDAQKKPKVGGAINPNIEEIVALRPDLVLVTKSFNRLETVRALEGLGISVYATDPHTVTEIVSSTERLAEVLGAPEAGNSLGAELERRLADLQQRMDELPQRRVLFVVWADPLISIGKHTFIADALHWAGAESIVNSTQDWPEVNFEEVAHLQPDFLVIAPSHLGGSTHDLDIFAERPGWRDLDAVRNRRIAVISDAINRPSPRIVSAIEGLARQLHPEAFTAHTDGGRGNMDGEKQPRVQPPGFLLSMKSSGDNAARQEACACAR